MLIDLSSMVHQDHSLESAIPVAAVALGACVIEKHLMLPSGREQGGPDSAFSTVPQDFKRLVDEVTSETCSLRCMNA